MLLGSSTLWAADIAKIGNTTYTDAQAEELWAACSSTPGTYTVVEICNVTFDFIIPAGKYVELRPAGVKKKRVYVYDHSNGNITNNGNLKIVFGTWSGGTFLNNGSMIIGSTGTGTTAFAPSYLGDAEYTLATDSYEYTYVNPSSTYDGYKYVMASADIVATVNGQPYTASTFNVAMENSTSSYPVVMQKNFTVSSLTVNWEALSYDVYIELNGKNITINGGEQHGVIIKNSKLHISNNGEYDDAHGILTSNASVATLLVVGTDNIEHSGIYSGVYVGPKVTVKNTDLGCGIAVEGPSGSSTIANGAYVEIAGTVVATQGSNNYTLNLNGNIQNTLYYPSFNILDGAIIGNDCNLSACIYAAGYGLWNIGAATLKANTPIYAKAGQVTINGATIEACGAYADPQPYGDGFYPTGDAIIFDSKNGYEGNMQLTITDATITSANGYAVQEVLTDREESQTLSMTINGGKFKGEKGTIVVSENFNVSTPTRWANNSIKSGKYTSAPNEVADGYVVALNTDDDKADYPYVVVADNTYPGVVTEITENTTVESLVEIAENNGILVKSGVTYEVKGIEFKGANSRIIVEAGATLIVGESGFIGSDADRMLVLEADKANGTAKLLFNGTTEAASHPYAKVEQYMYSKALETGNLWQHIGIPTQATPVKISKTDPYMFNTWTAAKGWEYSGQVGVTSPWTGYNCATNRVTEGSKLTYEGTLEGKSPTKFVLEPNGYSCFANSFTAPMSILGFINSIPDGVSDNMVWIYKAADYDTEGLGFKQYLKSTIELEDNDCGIAPMQAFFLKNNTDAEVALNPVDYATAVLGFTPKGASADELNGGFIYISDNNQQARLQIIEKENLSDNFDPNYDGEQMVTDFIQIYVVQGDKKLSAIGTNSLEGKEITIVTKDATQYTLTFKSLKGNAFKLTDIVTGTEIEVGEGKTYTFTADANSTIKRFKLGEGEVSADEADANNVNVWVANNSMNIAGATEGDAIEVINLAGIKVLSATATGEAVQTIPLSGIASGAYIVKAGAATVKVIK